MRISCPALAVSEIDLPAKSAALFWNSVSPALVDEMSIPPVASAVRTFVKVVLSIAILPKPAANVAGGRVAS